MMRSANGQSYFWLCRAAAVFCVAASRFKTLLFWIGAFDSRN